MAWISPGDGKGGRRSGKWVEMLKSFCMRMVPRVRDNHGVRSIQRVNTRSDTSHVVNCRHAMIQIPLKKEWPKMLKDQVGAPETYRAYGTIMVFG